MMEWKQNKVYGFWRASVDLHDGRNTFIIVPNQDGFFEIELLGPKGDCIALGTYYSLDSAKLLCTRYVQEFRKLTYEE